MIDRYEDNKNRAELRELADKFRGSDRAYLLGIVRLGEPHEVKSCLKTAEAKLENRSAV